MKKVICVILLTALLIGILSACGAFKCDCCGNFTVGKKHDVKGMVYMGGAEDAAFLHSIMGPQTVCDDCIEYFGE